MPVYESDPDAASDADFEPGSLAHLVAGSRGRLLDARRTPVTVLSVAPERGAFELRVDAFEDRGARWELALGEVRRLQFPLGAAIAPPAAVAVLEAASVRFDAQLVVAVDDVALRTTERALATEERAASRALDAGRGLRALDLDAAVARRRGDPRLIELLERFLADRGVAELDRSFATTFVSNPRSGELVKGHAIVLAELGLCPYRGQAPRDPELLGATLARELRARHLVARIGFMRALWRALDRDVVTLFRAAAAEGPLRPAASAPFASWTFSRAVADAHFEGGPSTTTAALWRRRVPTARVFMTFLETAALNSRFLEAEAVLIEDAAPAGSPSGW